MVGAVGALAGEAAVAVGVVPEVKLAVVAAVMEVAVAVDGTRPNMRPTHSLSRMHTLIHIHTAAQSMAPAATFKQGLGALEVPQQWPQRCQSRLAMSAVMEAVAPVAVLRRPPLVRQRRRR